MPNQPLFTRASRFHERGDDSFNLQRRHSFQRDALALPSRYVLRVSLFTGELGDRLLGALIVNQRLAGDSRGDQRGDGGVVERAWQPQAELVQPCDGIIGELSRALDYAEHRTVFREI